MTARDTALRLLIDYRTRGSWPDAAMKQVELPPRDTALCTRLCYGVLQNQALLDWYLDQLLTGRKRLPPALRDILRLGAFQILFLDRIPPAAAVNEAVNQARKRFGEREAGVCNGVLRNLLRQKNSMVPPADYHIRYSHPEALVELMKDSVGKRLGRMLEADNSIPELCAVWNPLQCEESALLDRWTEEAVAFRPHPWLAHGYLLQQTGAPTRLGSFQEGMFQIQDAAAALSVAVLGLAPGMRVLDLCAAPGGKSLAAARAMGNQGEVLSCDIHAGKLPQIDMAAKRMGASMIRTLEHDACVPVDAWRGKFDAVIADVPCSGLGVIRKKPDIRYRDLSAIEELPALQGRILDQASACVAPGGQLLYSTCTVLFRENEAVVQSFLENHPAFECEKLELPEPLAEQASGMVSLYQGWDDCDGFFICRMRRREA